jgi:hypothetical protein
VPTLSPLGTVSALSWICEPTGADWSSIWRGLPASALPVPPPEPELLDALPPVPELLEPPPVPPLVPLLPVRVLLLELVLVFWLLGLVLLLEEQAAIHAKAVVPMMVTAKEIGFLNMNVSLSDKLLIDAASRTLLRP